MDVMLQKHCARHIYVVPDGLRELMSDISREVLRSQPDDLYTFIADYLDALMIVRENARIAAKFVEILTESAETIIDLINSSGMSLADAHRAATVIQEAFKAWSNKKGIIKEDENAIVAKIVEDAHISDSQADQAATCIQNAFRAFKMRHEREQALLDGIIDWRVAARSAIKLYRKTGVSPEEAERAANLIKASYKGYYTRRALRKLNEASQAVEEIEEEEEEEEVSSEESILKTEKKKGVRIDYQSVVPHVDFGDEELIKKEVSVEEIEDESGPREYVMSSTDVFVRNLLDKFIMDKILSQQEEEEETKQAPKEDQGSIEKVTEIQSESIEPPQESSLQEPGEGSPDEIKTMEEEDTTQAQTEEATEAPVEAPNEESTEAPTEIPTDVPEEMPTEEPKEELEETPVETPTEAPKEISPEEPNEAPAETPSEVPPEIPPEEAPEEPPVDSSPEQPEPPTE